MNRKRKVIFSSLSYENLDEIHDYISENGYSERAAKVVAKILSKIEDIAQNPRFGTRVELLGIATSWRKCSVFSYLIFYRQDGNTIRIGAIIHGMRDLDDILQTFIDKDE